MRPLLLLLTFVAVSLCATAQDVNDWIQLMPGSDFTVDLADDESHFDRANQRIYFRNPDSQTLGYVDLNNSTIVTLPASGWFGTMTEMVVDPDGGMIYGWRAGRETVYGIPTTGGSWSVVSSNGGDAAYYGASSFWNPLTDGVGIYAGYGGFSMKNAIHEIPGMSGGWVETRPNTNTGNPPRAWSWVSINEAGDELYIYGRHGNINGSQYQYPLSIVDDANYNWARGLWKVDLSDHSTETLISLDDPAVLQYTDIAYDYSDNLIYVSGGSLLAANASNTNQGTTTNITQFHDLNSPNGFELLEVGTAYPAEGGPLWYDGVNDRLLHYGESGLWSLSLAPPGPVEGCTAPTACNFNPQATIDNGTCSGTCIDGCTDPTACNFNPDATQDDGSCIDLSLSMDNVTISPGATATLNSNVPTTSTGTVCATRNENGDPITLTAPAGGVFTSVEFASYGEPNGNCGSYSTGSCHASSSTQVVSSLCIGQNSCTIYPNNSTFGDPCVGTGKRLFIELGYQSTSEFDVSWSNGSTEPSITVQPTETTTYTVTVTTPQGSCTESATVTIAVPGCTDSSACNYNEEANEDDGSCSYPPAFLVDNTTVVDTVFAQLNQTLMFESATQAEADSTLLDAFSVFFNAFSAHSLPVLASGTDYRLMATGRYGFADGWNHNDAAFNYAWDVATGTKVNCNGTQDAQEDVRWLYDGATDFQRPDNDTDNNVQFCSGVDKTYFWTLPGDGNSHTVGFIDNGGYGDNSGELSFQLYELSHSGGITWPNGITGGSWSYEANATGIFDFTLSNGPCSANLVIVVGHPGCMDANACNFDSTAVLEDGSCVYADPGADCSDNCPEWPQDTVMQCLNSSTVLDAGIQRGTYFDGIDDYILMSESGVTGTNPMTISYWALTTNNQRMDIFSQACDSDCGTDIRLGMNTPQCGLVGPSFKSPAHFATFPFDVDDGNWHQYTYVFGDGSFSYNNLKIYVDGALFSAATADDYCGHNWGGWTYNAQDIPIRLGYGLPLGGMFSGYLDDVAVWEEALQPDEVNALLTASPSQIGDQLLSYWPLDELQNGFFTDVVGGNDGAPIGGIGEDPADARGVVTWYSGTQMPVIEVFPNQTTTYTAEMVLTTGQVCQDSIVIEVGTDLFSDVDGNGVCDAFEQEGCTDEAACNYSLNAISDDGSCDYTCCPGPGCCDDPSQWDVALQQCNTAAPDTIVVMDTLLVPTPFCGAGTHWDPVTEMCIADLPSTTDENCTVMNLQELAEGYQILLDHTAELDSLLAECNGTTSAPESNGCADESSITYDGHDYDLVQIGDQCWFAENLQTKRYNNGDLLEGDLSNGEWSSTTSGAQAVRNNDDSNLPSRGRLYNWFAVVDTRGLCPSGWHVPTDAEWMTLELHLGMPQSEVEADGSRGSNEGQALKASSSNSPPWNGNNSTGFTAYPGGARNNGGTYYAGTTDAFIWTSTTLDGNSAWLRDLDIDTHIERYGYPHSYGFSVRCLKN